MKKRYRIIDNPTSTHWIYIIEVKSFLFWRFVKGCDTIEEGKEIIKTRPNRFRLSDYSKVKYEVEL